MKAAPSQGEQGFQFLRTNPRQEKPRQRGLTEIRGAYYSVVGKRYLQDLFETMGAYVDSLKFGGGSFCLMPRKIIREINDLCHENEVAVSTGGFMYDLTLGLCRPILTRIGDRVGAIL